MLAGLCMPTALKRSIYRRNIVSVGGKTANAGFSAVPSLARRDLLFFGFINTVPAPPWTCVFPASTRFESMFNYHSRPLGLYYDISYLFLAK